MASVAAAVGDINSTANQLGTYSSAVAFTPVAGDLLVVVSSFSATTDNTVACTESAGGGTYTQVAMKEWNGTGSRMYVHIRDALIGASPVSRQIRLDLPADAATGCVATVLRVTGMTKAGLTAMLQSAVAKNSASVPGITFGAACQTGNPVLSYYATSSANPPATTLPGSPFNSSFQSGGYSTPTNGGQVLKSDSGFTGTSITYGSSDAGAWGMIGIELDSSAGGSTVNGTAVSNPAASLVVAGSREVFGTGLANPADTLVVASLRTIFGTGLANPADTLVVAGLRTVLGTGLANPADILVVLGTVTPAGPATIFGTALLAPSDTLVVAGLRTVLGLGVSNPADTLVVLGTRTVLGTGLANPADTLVVAGTRSVLGLAALNPADLLTVLGDVTHAFVEVFGQVLLVPVAELEALGEVMAHAPLLLRGTAPSGGKAYSPTQLTRTGFQYPMDAADGTRVYITRQYVIQVPKERRAVDIHGTEWRVNDRGLLEPV